MTNKDGEEVHKNGQVKFLESCRFMTSSLDKLASNLDDDQCKNFGRVYTKDNVFKLMRHKVYIHVNKWIAGTKEIVLLNMNMKGISDQDHEHAHQVWNRITPEFQNVTLEDL